MALEGTLDQQQKDQPYLPRWKRNKMKSKSKDADAADAHDPCCPSADGYSEYRNREQIERQSKEAAVWKKRPRGDTAVAAPSAHPPQYNPRQAVWFYRDNTSGAIQGPFAGEQMIGWRAFFPPTTPVRFGTGGTFCPLSEVDFLTPNLPPPPPPPLPPPPALGNTDVSLDETTADADDGFTDGLGTSQKQGAIPPLTAEDALEPRVSEAKIAQPPENEDGSRSEDGEGDGHLNNEQHSPEVEMCIPPPDEETGMDDENDGPEVDLDDEGNRPEVDMCVPPPSDDERDDHSGVPYPEVGEYPLPTDDAVPYPVDVEYPVDDAYAYPNASDPYGDAPEIMAVAPYPSTEDILDTEGEGTEKQLAPPVEEKKKKYEGDKAVVGLLPSHLRVKRKNTKQPNKQASRPAATNVSRQAPEKASIADDYNKFMSEISELK